uniref:(northern house mosquito) hypothetical protein n=1 Tax=Culex pipiens TaxID=7175 RepID=A0A8D8J4R6_CULPI
MRTELFKRTHHLEGFDARQSGVPDLAANCKSSRPGEKKTTKTHQHKQNKNKPIPKTHTQQQNPHKQTRDTHKSSIFLTIEKNVARFKNRLELRRSRCDCRMHTKMNPKNFCLLK